MKLYALTYIFIDPKKLPNSIETNILLFSDKYDKIVEATNRQLNYLKQNLTETREIKPQNINLTELPRFNSEDPKRGYLIQASGFMYILAITSIQIEKPEVLNEKLQPGDFVTIKPEVCEVLKTSSSQYDHIDTNKLKIFKIVHIENNKAVVQVCGIHNPQNHNSIDCMGRNYTYPLSWFKRLYL